jgi:hypothetical protein
VIPHARPTFKRKLRDAFTQHLLLKFAALFFALVLWLVVSAEEPTEEVMGVRFEPSLDSGVVIDGAVPNVRALVLGRGREILKLYSAAPVIHRRVRSGLRDSIRVELGPADVDLPAGVTAAVRDVRPRVVTLRLRRVAPVLPSDTATDVDQTPGSFDSARAAGADSTSRDSLTDSTAGGDVRRIPAQESSTPGMRRAARSSSTAPISRTDSAPRRP